MRRGLHGMTLGLLVACLGACEPDAAPNASLVQPRTAAPAAPAPTPLPGRSAADAGLAVAIAREAADHDVRTQTLHVQRLLREQERAREAAIRARDSGNERCIGGQKMHRVANGWEQAGVC
jgi:hypothetical protein